jgi:choline dehydrogenase-like flavoprotein
MADVLVVGGGSAGGLLAARLSEDAACQVVLLEAGQDIAGEGSATSASAIT